MTAPLQDLTTTQIRHRRRYHEKAAAALANVRRELTDWDIEIEVDFDETPEFKLLIKTVGDLIQVSYENANRYGGEYRRRLGTPRKNAA